MRKIFFVISFLFIINNNLCASDSEYDVDYQNYDRDQLRVVAAMSASKSKLQRLGRRGFTYTEDFTVADCESSSDDECQQEPLKKPMVNVYDGNGMFGGSAKLVPACDTLKTGDNCSLQKTFRDNLAQRLVVVDGVSYVRADSGKLILLRTIA